MTLPIITWTQRLAYKYRELRSWDPPQSNTSTRPRRVSSNPATNHLTIIHSTPLDCTGTSDAYNRPFTMKSQSGISSFSLGDKLRSLRPKSPPSSSTTHNVALNGLKSDRKINGTLLSYRIERIEADQTSSGSTPSQPQKNGDVVHGTAFGNVRSSWLQQPTSVSFRH